MNNLQSDWKFVYEKHQEILNDVSLLTHQYEVQKTKLEFQALILRTIGVYIPLEKFRTIYMFDNEPTLRVDYQNLVFGNIRANSSGLYLERVDGLKIQSMVTYFDSLFMLGHLLKSIGPKNLVDEPEEM